MELNRFSVLFFLISGHIFVRDLGIKDECEEGNFLFTMYEDRKWVGFGHGIPGIVAPGPKKNVYNYPNGTTLRV